jgi:DNA (cytosine-5)-methyltransferase 1
MVISKTGLAQTASFSDYSDVPLFEKPRGTFISLYAGAGGLDIGFALAGYSPVWVSELDAAAMKTHDNIFEDLRRSRPHLVDAKYESRVGDILAISKSDLPGRHSADLVIGGPPCQGFSVAGKMDPNDARSKHVFHFMDVVDRVRPKAFLLENVKALFENKRWSGVRSALVSRAEDMGYNVSMTLVNAADYGVPQSRERMLLIGVRSDIGQPVNPEPTTPHLRPTVRQALRQLPNYGLPGNDSACTARITSAKSPILRRSAYAGMLFNGAGRPLNPDAPSLTLAASMGGNKTHILDQSILDDPQKPSWVLQYHEQLWASDGLRTTTEVPETLRRLTVEEAAALQTFPLGVRWEGPISSRFRQIGNAVPPRLALAAAKAISRSIES